MQPLSTKIAVPIDTSVADQDYGFLAHQLRSQPRYLEEGTLTVVFWHHGNIPSLVRALGATSNSFADPWDANVFNVILVLTYLRSGAPDLSIVTEGF